MELRYEPGIDPALSLHAPSLGYLGHILRVVWRWPQAHGPGVSVRHEVLAFDKVNLGSPRHAVPRSRAWVGEEFDLRWSACCQGRQMPTRRGSPGWLNPGVAAGGTHPTTKRRSSLAALAQERCPRTEALHRTVRVAQPRSSAGTKRRFDGEERHLTGGWAKHETRISATGSVADPLR